jgi:hypothetical protein
MEFAIFGGMATVLLIVVIWVIHMQTLHARDMQSTLLQRQLFNFEKLWQTWNEDRKQTDATIQSLAGWNARLCENTDLRHQQLMSLVSSATEKSQQQLTTAVSEHLRASFQSLVKMTNNAVESSAQSS